MGKQFAGEVFAQREPASTTRRRRQARPVKRIIDKKTRQVVGWLYQWDSGHLAPMWKAGRCENVVYE